MGDTSIQHPGCRIQTGVIECVRFSKPNWPRTMHNMWYSVYTVCRYVYLGVYFFILEIKMVFYYIPEALAAPWLCSRVLLVTGCTNLHVLITFYWADCNVTSLSVAYTSLWRIFFFPTTGFCFGHLLNCVFVSVLRSLRMCYLYCLCSRKCSITQLAHGSGMAR